MVISMERWIGKVAIITGASAGIGAAIVEQLVEAGLKVVGLARRKEKLEELAKKLEGKKGKLYAYQTDMTKEEDILEAFQWAKNNLGPIHILVNNAGIARTTNLTNGNTKFWKEILDTNVLGLCIATREAVKDMRENNVAGHIIHINSVAGHIVPYFPDLNVYSASKYAVTALTETLRQELNSIGSKIKITSISPGMVATEIVDASYKGSGSSPAPELKEFVKKFPYLQANDIADGVMYVLATPPHVQVHELMIRPIGEPV
ncbi:hypothetical protein ILUMI_04040 [Ignelater luminosus]|uniref:Farnesol dehydrogenase n=1 Tax=Ignelater luminosus TaxID=2038154 RepID=A0A8K0DEL7_IGNLU|nr:hypothetical protein ILUMI_04040 [Ignelater luminosus]